MIGFDQHSFLDGAASRALLPPLALTPPAAPAPKNSTAEADSQSPHNETSMLPTAPQVDGASPPRDSNLSARASADDSRRAIAEQLRPILVAASEEQKAARSASIAARTKEKIANAWRRFAKRLTAATKKAQREAERNARAAAKAAAKKAKMAQREAERKARAAEKAAAKRESKNATTPNKRRKLDNVEVAKTPSLVPVSPSLPLPPPSPLPTAGAPEVFADSNATSDFVHKV